MSKIITLFIFSLLFVSLGYSQTGYWEGFLTQDGVKYPMTFEIKKEGGELIGYTNVIVGDSIYGGVCYGEIHWDRSINLWDHIEKPKIYPDKLPQTVRRRYQLVYRRSAIQDTIKGHWQEVHKNPKDPYKYGRIELKRVENNAKA